MKNKDIKQIKSSELFEAKKYDLLNNNPYLKAFEEFKKSSIFNTQTGAVAQLNKMSLVFDRINQLPKFSSQFQNHEPNTYNPFFISQTGAIAELNKMSSLFERINQIPKFYNQFHNDLSILEKLNLVLPKSNYKQSQFNKFKIDTIGLSGLISDDLPFKINEDLKDENNDSISLSNAVFLDSFSNVKTELNESEITQIETTFKNKSFIDLIESFYEEYLQNGFTKELTIFLSSLIPLKDKKSLKKVMSVIISILFLYYNFIKPFIKENPTNYPKKEIGNK